MVKGGNGEAGNLAAVMLAVGKEDHDGLGRYLWIARISASPNLMVSALHHRKEIAGFFYGLQILIGHDRILASQRKTGIPKSKKSDQ